MNCAEAMEGKAEMEKKKNKIVKWILLVSVLFSLFICIVLWSDRKYSLVSLMIVLLALIPNCYSFEKRQANTRKMVLIAVMVALSVVGRGIFVLVPFFKPVTAIVVITAIYFGAEAGFLTGALSAVISNFFFGQGPWTPFQMFTWGMIGFVAGIPFMQKFLKKKIPLVFYGIVSGFLFSLIMDIWTVVFMDGGFVWKRYGALLISGLPVSLIYAVSNVLFLLILQKPIGEKLERIRIKYGI